jgi:hypothetical protein
VTLHVERLDLPKHRIFRLDQAAFLRMRRLGWVSDSAIS